ncbi:MAG: CBS domain-containing protein [Desulfobulbaceae bacterium]|nr:CBS domain-containing protein [Desulfobulbaceae bacterium]
MHTAAEIMTKEVITVGLETGVEELARILWEKKIGGAPVVDANGQLLGVVTENDLIDQNKKVHIPTVLSILDSMIFLENPNKLDQEIKKMTGTKVGDIFSPHPITVAETATLEELASIMADRKVHTLPVVRDGKLVGIIGKSDLIRTLSR